MAPSLVVPTRHTGNDPLTVDRSEIPIKIDPFLDRLKF